MKTYAIYLRVQVGCTIQRSYLGKCLAEKNPGRRWHGQGPYYDGLCGVASFLRSDGTPGPNRYVCFSADKAAMEACKELNLGFVEVDECGNCEFYMEEPEKDEYF